MSQKLTSKERKAKELGYKLYKILLHLITIFCLWQIYSSVDKDPSWLLICCMCFFFLLVKHIKVSNIKRKANEERVT